MLPITAMVAAGTGDLTVVQPVLLVTGAGITGGGYTEQSISNERSYTLEELKSLGGLTVERLYSAINSSGTRRIYRSEGSDLVGLLARSNYSGNTITAVANDGYRGTVELGATRHYYPGIAAGDSAGSATVAPMLAWKAAVETAPAVPPASAMQDQGLQVLVGQTNISDFNNSYFVSNVARLVAGNEITEKPLSILGTAYTRGEMLNMRRAERLYSYSTQNGERNDRVRGVPLAILLDGLSDNTVIEFRTADDWAGISAYTLSIKELTARNAILAYETFEDASWKGIYRTVRSGPAVGYFTLYIDGEQPASMINYLGVQGDGAKSEYKHITHTGAPYNIDAITSATLTIEGPGVETSVPITVRELEDASNEIIHRGTYSDGRGQRSYEGIRLLPLLDGELNGNVSMLNDSVEIVFKNRWRQDVGRLTYGQIRTADQGNAPIILAYGTAAADGGNIRPFVFDGASGEDRTLGNGDGPLKLVYNMGMAGELPKSGNYSSIAYLYVEESGGRPGFKHTTASNQAYDNPANTEYMVTFTGDALGREVNFTVRELQDMVQYDSRTNRPVAGGLGHRDEYSLSNTTYWYVNEYEGIKLWDLLLRIGVPAGRANDDSTLVSFSSWDNYRINTQFSFRQLANPDLFYFYEKSPLDIGTDRPTRAQLATQEYQPGNQGTGWVRDGNNYPVKRGYPVMLAYGLNGYPYVRDSGLPGFRAGLGNDGGPLRLIYGKTDGLNRTNPGALENYAYFYNNGSQQLQRVQEIYVGEEVRYSTHMENPDPAYRVISGQAVLTVDIVSAGVTTTHSFTMEEIESIVYGVDKRTRDGEGRQEKGYYFYDTVNGVRTQDLFEGVNLDYLLTEHIGLQGTLGSVELYSGGGALPAAVLDLSTISDTGYNSLRGTEGLGTMLAFAKNGYPLVQGSSSAGYVRNDPHLTGRAIMNSGGPLMFVRGQTDAERAANRIENGVNGKTSVQNLTRIVINLVPDDFAHVGAEHAGLASQQVLFSGAVAKESGVVLTVGELETMQRFMVTGTYSISGTTRTYRGLDLLRLLNNKAIGASGLMDEIIITGVGGETKLTLEQLTDAAAAGKPVILAYGSSAGGPPGYAGAGPLIPPEGPMRLVIDGAPAADCVTNINEVSVIASSLDGWKHSTGVYTQYLGTTIEISGQNLYRNRRFTVAQIEAMDNIIVFDTYTVGTNNFWCQGVELYKLLQNIGFAGDLTTSEFTATATDGYSVQFSGSQLENGVNGKPIIISFGQGTTQSNGLPLVESSSDPGFSAEALNDGGPLRLMIHDNSGWSIKYLARITVGAEGGVDEDGGGEGGYGFTIYQGGREGGFPEAGVRSAGVDGDGGLWVGTYGGGLAYLPQGAGAFTVLDTTSNPSLVSPFTSGVAVDKDSGVWFSQNHSAYDSGGNNGVGYLKDGGITWYRAPGTVADDYVQSIAIGPDDNVWFGSAGGLSRYEPGPGFWRTWTVADGLPATSVNTVVSDGKGGVWIGCYPDGEGDEESPFTGGYAHVTAAGIVDYTKSFTAVGAEMGDAWARGISVAEDGGAWIVRSAPGLGTIGGRVDYVNIESGAYMSWTGHELLGAGVLTGTQEIRAIAAEPNGGIWFGTSGAGLFHCLIPGVVHRVYSSGTGAWPDDTPMDNIFDLRFIDGVLYVGSAGGIAWTKATDGPFRPDPAPVIASRDVALQAIAALETGAGREITRAEFVKVLANMTAWIELPDNVAGKFGDVAADVMHSGYIIWAAAYGIVQGYPDGSFRPESPMTREEMAFILEQFAWVTYLLPSKIQEKPEYSDQGLVSAYAAKAVRSMQRFTVLDSIPGGAFRPKSAVTNTDAAGVLRAYVDAFWR